VFCNGSRVFLCSRAAHHNLRKVRARTAFFSRGWMLEYPCCWSPIQTDNRAGGVSSTARISYYIIAQMCVVLLLTHICETRRSGLSSNPASLLAYPSLYPAPVGAGPGFWLTRPSRRALSLLPPVRSDRRSSSGFPLD
jgi:hypothetical protein